MIPLAAWERTRRVGRSLAAVCAVTAVLVFGLKRIIARVRPCNCLEDVKARFFLPPSDFSFPSGHAAGSFTFCVFLAIVLVKTTPLTSSPRERLGRRAGAATLVALAFAVALSRIALGVHFPADVVAGAILGSTVAAVGAAFHRRAVEAER